MLYIQISHTPQIFGVELHDNHQRGEDASDNTGTPVMYTIVEFRDERSRVEM